MATALMAWLRAPAPTTCTPTAPDWRTTPAIAPATELGFDLLETFSVSTVPRILEALPGPFGRTLRHAARRFLPLRAICHNRHGGWATPLLRSEPFLPRFARRAQFAQQERLNPTESVVEHDRFVVALAEGHVGNAALSRVGPDAGQLTDAGVDGDHQLGVVDQELLGVLLALTELLALVRVPGARLLHDAHVDAHVDDRALAADALAVHDVELGLAERRSDLVLDYLHPGAVADHLDAVLDGLDAADVEPHRRVELQRPPARRRLRRAEHDADLLPQ